MEEETGPVSINEEAKVDAPTEPDYEALRIRQSSSMAHGGSVGRHKEEDVAAIKRAFTNGRDGGWTVKTLRKLNEALAYFEKTLLPDFKKAPTVTLKKHVEGEMDLEELKTIHWGSLTARANGLGEGEAALRVRLQFEFALKVWNEAQHAKWEDEDKNNSAILSVQGLQDMLLRAEIKRGSQG